MFASFAFAQPIGIFCLRLIGQFIGMTDPTKVVPVTQSKGNPWQLRWKRPELLRPNVSNDAGRGDDTDQPADVGMVPISTASARLTEAEASEWLHPNRNRPNNPSADDDTACLEEGQHDEDSDAVLTVTLLTSKQPAADDISVGDAVLLELTTTCDNASSSLSDPGNVKILHSKLLHWPSSALGGIEAIGVRTTRGGPGAGSKKKRKQKIEDDRTYGQEERDRRTVIRGVVSSFLSSLCNHIRDGARFDLIWIELRNSLELTMDIFDEQCGDDNPEKRKECMDSMSHLIGLVHQCIEVRGGSLLVGGSEMNRLSTVLQKVLAEETFSRIDKRVQASALDLLCSMWRAKPEHSDFATKFSSCFPILLEKGNSDDTLLDPALVLAKNLLPYLPWGVSKRSLVPALLVAAANRCPGDGALVVLHTIATARVSGAVSTEDDELFWSDHARDCEISEENRKALLAVCLIEPSSGFNTEEGMARVGYIARCLPFLSSLNSSVAYHDNDDESHFPEIKSVFSWCFSVLNFLSKPSKISKSKENKFEFKEVNQEAQILSLEEIKQKIKK